VPVLQVLYGQHVDWEICSRATINPEAIVIRQLHRDTASQIYILDLQFDYNSITTRWYAFKLTVLMSLGAFYHSKKSLDSQSFYVDRLNGIHPR
jgi:hypothetical protein